ncbi:hypothetical protein, partial [Streptomyces parvus]
SRNLAQLAHRSTRQTLTHRLRPLNPIGLTHLEVKDFNEKESIMTVSAEMLRTYLLIVAVLAIREGIEAWRGDVESLFEVLEDLEDDDDDAEEKIR